MAVRDFPKSSPLPLDLDRTLIDAVSHGTVRIPPYPVIALKVQDLVRRGEFGLVELAQLVSSDAVLAADVLRCANAALFRRGPPVLGLTQAMTRIGAQQVVALALSSSLGSHALATGALASFRRRIWIESLASAIICQELARAAQLSVDTAYTLGLLHDFGAVVAAACLEAILAAHPCDAPRPLASWADLVARHHITMGLLVAEQWKLPSTLREVIAAHHGDVANHCTEPALLELVRASDQIVPLLGARPHITSGDLLGIPMLQASADREAMALVLQRIPEFITSFERQERVAPAASASWIAPPPPLGRRAREVSFTVEVCVGRQARTYTATSISTHELTLTGKDALPESRLFEVSLQCHPRPFKAWALSRSCRPNQGAFRVELQPYALSREIDLSWNTLLQNADAS